MLSKDQFIPLSEPELGGREWDYIKDCLDTNWVSSAGSYVEQFESRLADYLGVSRAVATSSGTAALHVSLLAAGVSPGDEVIVSDLTFIAPANAVRYIGAWPVFIDADPEFWQMDSEKLKDFISSSCRWENNKLVNNVTRRVIKAILPVHILGHPCDMDPILELAIKYNLRIIEDSTESLGAKYKGSQCGVSGDMGCFSFNGNKMLTTGGGGMITTNDSALADRAKYLTTQARDDSIEYIHNEVGFNYRLTNLQAALGCAQIERLNKHLSSKKAIAARYNEAFNDLSSIGVMAQASWANSAFWLYTILIDEEQYGLNSRNLLTKLHANGIQTRPLWQPMHMSQAHQGAYHTNCEVSERLWRDALSIPCSVGLTQTQQDRVIETILP